ncbi:MAG: DUF3800 domain-containing protein [Myxococcales bacterium]|nr:DUF3800 domain-containing protein [Myxococcales bacterium]
MKTKPTRLPSWASRKPISYVVAIDDSGQKHVRPSLDRRCFFLGGVILPAANVDKLRGTWAAHGAEHETKARTYTSTFGVEERPRWAEALLSVEMDHWGALPLWIAFDKNEAGDEVTLPTRLGGRRIDPTSAIRILVSMLAIHLEHVRGGADHVLIDHMASEAEEELLQDGWNDARERLEAPLQRRLPTTLTFVDSKSTPEVQVADVLTGLLRAAHEEHRPIAPGLVRLLRKAEQQKLFGFHLS